MEMFIELGICRDGEVGKRGRFKSCSRKRVVGSSPTLGTRKTLLNDGVFLFEVLNFLCYTFKIC